jgi:FkbM family methyltransferase
MKYKIAGFLQNLLGLRRYLFFYSVAKALLYRFRRDTEGGAFLKFVSILPENSAVLDIGANIGYTMAVLSRRANHVYAFEPIPINYITAKRIKSFFNLKNVSIYNWALGDEEKQIEMIMPIHKSARLQAYSYVMDAQDDMVVDGDHVVVPCKRLDDLDMFQNEANIKAIKIDVEGYEYFVFHGGEEFIKRHRPIIFAELADEENRHKCLSFFDKLGYDVKVFDGMDLVDYSDYPNWNYFFLPRPI